MFLSLPWTVWSLALICALVVSNIIFLALFVKHLRGRVALRDEYSALERDYVILHTRFEESLSQHSKQIELLQSTKESLHRDFEILANRVLDTQSQTLNRQNQTQLELILQPFKEQVEQFGVQAREQFVEQIKGHSTLKTELIKLQELNRQISQDAINLTDALKGENKTQGDWGEVVLERVLESSGLREGEEFQIQKSYRGSDGRYLRPDVVIFLPQNRSVVIDSKVSLLSFERYCSASCEEEKRRALSDYITSLKRHVKDLSLKSYESIAELKTLDFVLLFMPIDSAFLLAQKSDNTVFKNAYESNIIIVSPSTLLATLRTIENLWRTQRQQQNAQEIALRAEGLYDKFVAFVEDMRLIGEQLDKTQVSWDRAMGRLSDGKGSLVKRVESMRELGLNPKKRLPKESV